MKINQAHIIIEKGVKFNIGSPKEGYIKYDFDKIIVYLEAKGKRIYGNKFKIYKADHPLIFKLCCYFIKDHFNCKKFGIDINKGILLSGPVGCGKTSLMKLLRYIVPHIPHYEVIPTKNIVFGFNNIGFKIIEAYNDKLVYCFDDLGTETTGKYFTNVCNVLGDILLARHKSLINHQIVTHATTNFNSNELKEHYGSDLHSKMQELFNYISFKKGAKNKHR